MELKWLEDCLALLEDRSFSKAAARRYISQPAFSRRIQSVEEWLGVAIVDRTTKPVTFRPAADVLAIYLPGMIQQFYELRSRVHAESQARRSVSVGAQEALAISVLPEITQLTRSMPDEVSFRVRSANRDECISMFLRGEIDVMLVYETARHPARVPAEFARSLQLGLDRLIPVCSRNQSRTHLQAVRVGHPLPILAYPAESFLGLIVKETALGKLMLESNITVSCESAFSAALKEMALKGMGIAWLPELLVQAELSAGTLVDLTHAFGAAELQIRIHFARAANRAPVQDIFTTLESWLARNPQPLGH